MKEAFRLLNKSIIRVEQPDIHLEEEEEETPMELEGKSTRVRNYWDFNEHISDCLKNRDRDRR